MTALPLYVERARTSDAEALCRAAVSAFAVDDLRKPPGVNPGGAPGNDDPARHRAWIRKWDYFKGSLGEKIVAGCIVKPRADTIELFGLFVAAPHMRHGFGGRLLRAVMGHYPRALAWVLETPDYATGNHRFYEAAGFHLLHRSPREPGLGFGFRRYRRPGRLS